MSSPLLSLAIRRWFAAQPDTVFLAFSEPRLLEQWFCPSPEATVKVAHLDLRVGGSYRLLYYFPGAEVVPVAGEYRRIVAARQLVFTWTWEPPDPYAGVETLVTVDFLEAGGGTEVVVTHERFPTEAKMLQHQSGWGGTLARLDHLLALNT